MDIDERASGPFGGLMGLIQYKSKDGVFDVIVLGGRLGGLIAATHLVKEGRSVLLLKERNYRPYYTREGYRFVPFSNLTEKQIPADLLKSIPSMISPVTHRKKSEKTPPNLLFQVILPEARIDLYRERSLLQREWRREFPDEKDRIESFYTELERVKEVLKKRRQEKGSFFGSPTGGSSFLKRWWSKRGLPKGGTHQWLSPFSPEFKKLIELQMLCYGYLCSTSYPIPLVAHLLLKDEENEQPPLDLEKVECDLMETFIREGGIVKEIDGVKKIETGWRKGVSVLLTGEEISYRSRFFLLNSPLHSLSTIFGKKRNPFSKWEERIRPRYVLVPFFLGIREKGIPVGMGNFLVSILNLEKPYEGGNLLFLSLSKKREEHQAPEGKRALTVLSFLPYEGLTEDAFSKLQDEVLTHINYLFPFLDEYMEFVDGQWAEDQISCWSYPHYFYETESGFKWDGEFVPSRVFRNIYLCGREIYPHLGLEGEIRNGLRMGAELLRRCH